VLWFTAGLNPTKTRARSRLRELYSMVRVVMMVAMAVGVCQVAGHASEWGCLGSDNVLTRIAIRFFRSASGYASFRSVKPYDRAKAEPVVRFETIEGYLT
jgi:hypothetical protein